MEIEFKDNNDSETYRMLSEWKERIDKTKETEKSEEWYSIPALPNYIFKNLRIVGDSDFENPGEITITLKCDEWDRDIMVGDKVLVDNEYEETVTSIDDNDILHFENGNWASKILCKRID